MDSVSDAEKTFSNDEPATYLPSALIQILYHLKHASSTE